MWLLYLLFVLISLADASRDDTYYNLGGSNPLVNRPLYWRDAKNVLQDLSSFTSLHVKFHSCVWSPSPAASYYGNGNGENHNNGGGGDNNDWYLGSMYTDQANVAFSLYGVTSDTAKIGRSACDKKHYINSFYTTAGFVAFVNSAVAAGAEGKNGPYVNSLSPECNQNYAQGVTCEGSQFVMAHYGISQFASYTSCHGSENEYVEDHLTDMNEYLESLECVQIYDQTGNLQNNGRELEGDNNQFDTGDPLTLLSFSTACTYADPYQACPDPFGGLKAYASALNPTEFVSASYELRAKKSIAMFALGLLTFLIIVKIVLDERSAAYDEVAMHDPIKRKSRRRNWRGLGRNKVAAVDLVDEETGSVHALPGYQKRETTKATNFFSRFYRGKSTLTQEPTCETMPSDDNSPIRSKDEEKTPDLKKTRSPIRKLLVGTQKMSQKALAFLEPRPTGSASKTMSDGVEKTDSDPGDGFVFVSPDAIAADPEMVSAQSEPVHRSTSGGIEVNDERFAETQVTEAKEVANLPRDDNTSPPLFLQALCPGNVNSTALVLDTDHDSTFSTSTSKIAEPPSCMISLEEASNNSSSNSSPWDTIDTKPQQVAVDDSEPLSKVSSMDRYDVEKSRESNAVSSNDQTGGLPTSKNIPKTDSWEKVDLPPTGTNNASTSARMSDSSRQHQEEEKKELTNNGSIPINDPPVIIDSTRARNQSERNNTSPRSKQEKVMKIPIEEDVTMDHGTVDRRSQTKKKRSFRRLFKKFNRGGSSNA